MFTAFHIPMSTAWVTYRKSFLTNMFQASLPHTWDGEIKNKLTENLNLVMEMTARRDTCIPSLSRRLDLTENTVKETLEVAGSLPQLSYKCAAARELFSNNLPVLTIYSFDDKHISLQAYLVKKSQGIDWNVLASLQWPTTNNCRQMQMEELRKIVRPALAACTTELDKALLKCILSKIFSVQQLQNIKVASRGAHISTATSVAESTLLEMVEQQRP